MGAWFRKDDRVCFYAAVVVMVSAAGFDPVNLPRRPKTRSSA
jgi:hypothetical protein